MHQHRHVIADLVRNPEGRQGDTGDSKTKQSPTVILASRQYPQGPYRHSRVGGNPQGGRATRVNKTNQPIPRPVILASRQYPQGSRVTRGIQQAKTTNKIPSPFLMGEESKVRVRQYKTTSTPARHTGFKAVSTGQQGDAGHTTSQNNQTAPSFPRRRETTGWNGRPSYWLQGSIHSAGQQQVQTNQPIPLSLDGRGLG